MDFIKESSKTTNGKALESISSLKVMSTRVSGNMGRGVALENSTLKLRIDSTKDSSGMAKRMGTGKFWTVMEFEY